MATSNEETEETTETEETEDETTETTTTTTEETTTTGPVVYVGPRILGALHLRRLAVYK